jgi:hypothetical protein
MCDVYNILRYGNDEQVSLYEWGTPMLDHYILVTPNPIRTEYTVAEGYAKRSVSSIWTPCGANKHFLNIFMPMYLFDLFFCSKRFLKSIFGLLT